MSTTRMLSPHFSLKELTRTSIRDIDNTPDDAALFCLGKLCNWVLEDLRAHFGPIIVNSGYRCTELNKRIGGVPNSAHILGCAADIESVDDWVSVGEMLAFLATTGNYLPFEQAIDERGAYGDGWLHISIPAPGSAVEPRRELLVMRAGLYSVYVPVEL